MAVLETDTAVNAKRRKAHRLMQRHAGRIRQGDSGECLAVAQVHQDALELLVEPFAGALAARVFPDVRARVHRSVVGRALAMLAGVDVAVHPAVRALADKPRQVLQRLDDALPHPVLSRSFKLERDARVLNDGRIDGGEGFSV